MIIKSLKLFSYKLPLKKELVLHRNTISHREGFIIEIISDRGIKAISEIAPLPFYSQESTADVINEVSSFKKLFVHNPIPSDILNQLTVYAPSVRFGIESVLLQLTAQSKDLTLVDLLNPNAKQIVLVNALLTGSQSEIIERAAQLYSAGYRAFKIKVGRQNTKEEIATVHKVRKIVGEDSLIRLDANRAFDIKSGIEFYKQLKSVNINYIEEPFHSFEILDKYISENINQIPIALDESLVEIQPEMLNNLFALKAIVIKPTLLGYTNSMMFAKKAFALGIQPVISSSFETSIGTYLLASMGAIIDSSIPIGLDTLSWFQDDLVSNPISIKDGKIDLSQYTNINSQPDISKLTEVSLDNK